MYRKNILDIRYRNTTFQILHLHYLLCVILVFVTPIIHFFDTYHIYNNEKTIYRIAFAVAVPLSSERIAVSSSTKTIRTNQHQQQQRQQHQRQLQNQNNDNDNNDDIFWWWPFGNNNKDDDDSIDNDNNIPGRQPVRVPAPIPQQQQQPMYNTPFTRYPTITSQPTDTYRPTAVPITGLLLLSDTPTITPSSIPSQQPSPESFVQLNLTVPFDPIYLQFSLNDRFTSFNSINLLPLQRVTSFFLLRQLKSIYPDTEMNDARNFNSNSTKVMFTIQNIANLTFTPMTTALESTATATSTEQEVQGNKRILRFVRKSIRYMVDNNSSNGDDDDNDNDNERSDVNKNDVPSSSHTYKVQGSVQMVLLGKSTNSDTTGSTNVTVLPDSTKVSSQIHANISNTVENAFNTSKSLSTYIALLQSSDDITVRSISSVTTTGTTSTLDNAINNTQSLSDDTNSTNITNTTINKKQTSWIDFWGNFRDPVMIATVVGISVISITSLPILFLLFRQYCTLMKQNDSMSGNAATSSRTKRHDNNNNPFPTTAKNGRTMKNGKKNKTEKLGPRRGSMGSLDNSLVVLVESEGTDSTYPITSKIINSSPRQHPLTIGTELIIHSSSKAVPSPKLKNSSSPEKENQSMTASPQLFKRSSSTPKISVKKLSTNKTPLSQQSPNRSDHKVKSPSMSIHDRNNSSIEVNESSLSNQRKPFRLPDQDAQLIYTKIKQNNNDRRQRFDSVSTLTTDHAGGAGDPSIGTGNDDIFTIYDQKYSSFLKENTEPIENTNTNSFQVPFNQKGNTTTMLKHLQVISKSPDSEDDEEEEYYESNTKCESIRSPVIYEEDSVYSYREKNDDTVTGNNDKNDDDCLTYLKNVSLQDDPTFCLSVDGGYNPKILFNDYSDPDEMNNDDGTWSVIVDDESSMIPSDNAVSTYTPDKESQGNASPLLWSSQTKLGLVTEKRLPVDGIIGCDNESTIVTAQYETGTTVTEQVQECSSSIITPDNKSSLSHTDTIRMSQGPSSSQPIVASHAKITETLRRHNQSIVYRQNDDDSVNQTLTPVVIMQSPFFTTPQTSTDDEDALSISCRDLEDSLAGSPIRDDNIVTTTEITTSRVPMERNAVSVANTTKKITLSDNNHRLDQSEKSNHLSMSSGLSENTDSFADEIVRAIVAERRIEVSGAKAFGRMQNSKSINRWNNYVRNESAGAQLVPVDELTNTSQANLPEMTTTSVSGFAIPHDELDSSLDRGNGSSIEHHNPYGPTGLHRGTRKLFNPLLDSDVNSLCASLGADENSSGQGSGLDSDCETTESDIQSVDASMLSFQSNLKHNAMLSKQRTPIKYPRRTSLTLGALDPVGSALETFPDDEDDDDNHVEFGSSGQSSIPLPKSYSNFGASPNRRSSDVTNSTIGKPFEACKNSTPELKFPTIIDTSNGMLYTNNEDDDELSCSMNGSFSIVTLTTNEVHEMEDNNRNVSLGGHQDSMVENNEYDQYLV